MKIFNGFFILLFLSSCAREHESKTTLNNTNDVETIQITIWGQASALGIVGDMPGRMKAHRAKYNNINKSHIIVAPENEKELRVDASDAIIHKTKEDDVKDEIITIAKTYHPKRLVLFLAAHGFGDGSIGYETSSVGRFSPQKFVDIIDSLDELNRVTDASRRLEKLLIIPISCRNRVLADSIFTALQRKPFKTFSVVMTHMAVVGNERCGMGASVSHLLFLSELMINEYKNYQARDWLKKDNRTNRLLSIETLDNFVTIANEIVVNNVHDGHDRRHVITSFGADAHDQEINLAEFELKIDRLVIDRSFSLEPINPNVVDKHYRCTPAELVASIVSAPKLENAVRSIRGGNDETFVRGSREYSSPLNWSIDDALTIEIALP